jgi:hypothetical protein
VAFRIARGARPGIFRLIGASDFASVLMALHRDIYWVGRQWAVTGFGVQAVDQRLDGTFDIEASQVWDDILSERIRAQSWVYLVDFEKALALARRRFPAPATRSQPLVESVLELIQQPTPLVAPADLAGAGLPLQDTGEQAEVQAPAPLLLQLRTEGALARFLPQWRVRQ